MPLEANESVVDITAGQDHSMAVTSAGRLFSWGNNAHGKLGLPGFTDKEECMTPR